MNFSNHHSKDIIFLLILTLTGSISAMYIVWRANKTIMHLDNISNVALAETVK